MNNIPPHDKQSLRKHRKMLRRKAVHPRAGRSEATYSVKLIDQLAIISDMASVKSKYRTKSNRVTRNVEWVS